MKSPICIAIVLAIFSILTAAPPAQAQLLWRWFGPKTPDKAAPAKPTQTDAKRATEVSVEIAWLADPVTFPYYLEAHASAKTLEVRGYVPNKAVRDQALRIAQVYSALPVTDSMKEHPSLLVRPGLLSQQQLQASVQSSLRAALPKQYQQLKIDMAGDGKVFVMGSVNSYDEKIAVSQSLRRLHGCTSVQNLTALPADVVQSPPTFEPREKLPIVKTSNVVEPKPLAEQKSKSWLWPFGKSTPATTTDEPPLLDPRPTTPKNPVVVDAKKPVAPEGPILIPNMVEVKPLVPNDVVKVEVPAPPPMPKSPPLSAAELQKRVMTAWPGAKSVEVEFTSATEVRITLEIRDEKELSPAAERVFALPELERYRPDLQFKISTP